MIPRILAALSMLFLLSSCVNVNITPQSGPGSARLAVPVAAQGESDPRSITTSGEAVVMVAPDEVILTVGVETLDPRLAAAKAQNDEIAARAIQIARDHGIPQERIQTDYISISPLYDDYERKILTNYAVQKTIVMTLRDLDEFETLLTGLLEAGVTNVHGIQFRTTELRKYRDQARALAIQAAREKAEAMASELDQGVGEPLSIDEQYSGWYSGYGSWWGGRYNGMTQNVIQNSGPAPAMEGDGAVAPGQIEVSARVSVRFELE